MQGRLIMFEYGKSYGKVVDIGFGDMTLYAFEVIGVEAENKEIIIKCISPLPFEKSKQVVVLKIDKDDSVMFEGYKITPQDLFREE